MSAPRVSPWLLAPIAAVAWWVTGFLPWLVHGLRETRLTGGPFAPDQHLGDVRLAVPLVSEDLVALVVMAVLGGFLAGALTWLGRARPGLSAGVVVVGVAGACVIAIGQARAALSGRPEEDFAADDRVLLGLQIVVVAGTLVGLLLGLLLVLGPGVLRGTALAAPAVLLPAWVGLFRPGSFLEISPWLFAAGLGVALAVTGTSVGTRLLGWVPAAAVAWTTQSVLPALLVVTTMIRPGSGLEDHPWEPARAGLDVVRSAFTTPDAHLLRWWLLALVLGVVGGAVRWHRRSLTSGAGTPPPAADDAGAATSSRSPR